MRSCFAPRRPDQIDKIAVLCQTYGIPHVINNAYGVQSKSICSLVNRAMVLGRVDYIVSSLDKNFMVPVGGAFVASQSAEMIALVSRMYPGRGSITPTVDLFITLLSMGRETLLKLLREREERYVALSTALDALAQQHGERKLETPSNPISMGITLSPLTSSPSFLGAMLFQRCVSGARAVSCNADRNTRSVPATDIEGYTFIGWGAHCNSYPVSYLTAAVGVGMTEEEIAVFIDKLEKTLTRWRAPNGSDGAPCV